MNWFEEGNWAQEEEIDTGSATFMEMRIVRRFGVLDHGDMAALTGLVGAEIREAEDQLIDSDGRVLWFLDEFDQFWYHLPWNWWARRAV